MITWILGDLNPLDIWFKIGNDGTPEDHRAVDQSGHILRKVLVDVRLVRETLCGIVSRLSAFESSVYVIRGSRSRKSCRHARTSAPRIENREDQGICKPLKLTDYVDFEGMVDASEMIAHDACVIPAVLGNEILQP